MDLLYSRYASPFQLLNELISLNDFSDFIDEMYNKVENEKTWDFFLHKIFDKSFNDFNDDIKAENTQISQSEIEATVNRSAKIANACEWEVSDNGFI